jgi:hypothetical protein
MMVEFGGCSAGFEKLRSALAPVLRQALVGPSPWTMAPAALAIATAAQAIAADPQLACCGTSSCVRCRDMALGGPIL